MFVACNFSRVWKNDYFLRMPLLYKKWLMFPFEVTNNIIFSLRKDVKLNRIENVYLDSKSNKTYKYTNDKISKNLCNLMSFKPTYFYKRHDYCDMWHLIFKQDRAKDTV